MKNNTQKSLFVCKSDVIFILNRNHNSFQIIFGRISDKSLENIFSKKFIEYFHII